MRSSEHPAWGNRPASWRAFFQGAAFAAALTVFSSSASTITDNDVVGYWPGDGTAEDMSGSGNDGTLHNGATFKAGKYGSAFYFDGIDDYFSSPSTNLPIAGADRSISFWLCSPDVRVSETMLLGWGTPSTASMSALALGVRGFSSRRPGFWGFDRDFESGIRLQDNTWHHIGFTLTGGDEAKLYVDGQVAASQTLTSALTTPAGTTFYMADFVSTMSNFEGLLDDVAVFGRTLSDLEMRELACGAFIPYAGSGPGIRLSRKRPPPALVLPEARARHTAVPLPTGEVFIAGGLDSSGAPLASTVLVTPAGVTPGPDMASPRFGHTATLLGGSVFIAGGQIDSLGAAILDTTEIFNLTTHTFSAGPLLTEPRSKHGAAAFTNAFGEQIVFVGGRGAGGKGPSPYLASAEVLDVDTGVLTPTAGDLPAGQSGLQLAPLDSGKFLVVGGQNAGIPADPQVFDPASTTFASAPAAVARTNPAVASLGNEVLVAGGQTFSSMEDTTEIFDNGTETFGPGPGLDDVRSHATATISGSDVVLIGGHDGSGSASDRVSKIEASSSLATAQVTEALPLETGRFGHTATLADPATVVVAGGYNQNGMVLDTIELVDLTFQVPLRIDFLGTLQYSTDLEIGGWSNVPGACSPYYTPDTELQMFFRALSAEF